MRNLRSFDHSEFTGGINLVDPPSQIAENESTALLNLFPSVSGRELETRDGFAIASDSVSSLLPISLFGYRGYLKEGSSIMAVPAMLAAEIDDATDELVITATLFGGGVVPPKADLTDDMYWTDDGVDFVSGPGDGTGDGGSALQPIEYRLQDESFPNVIIPDLKSAGARQFQYARDVWLSELETSVPAQDNNDSLWGSENSTPDLNAMYDSDYYGKWVNEAYTSFFWDGWTKEDLPAFESTIDDPFGIQVFKLEDGSLKAQTVVQLALEALTGSTRKTPVFRPATVEFSLKKPANTFVYFRFLADDEKDAAVNIFYRIKSETPGPWIPFNTKSGYGQVPIEMTDQGDIAEADLRWTGKSGGINEPYITCGRSISFAEVSFKLEFRESSLSPGKADAGGLWHGLVVAGSEQ